MADTLPPVLAPVVRTLAVAVLLAATGCGDDVTNINNAVPTFTPDPIVSYDALKAALIEAVGNNSAQANGGLGLPMWAAVVDRAGVVVAVVYSGSTEDAQWPGSRAISAQKANTANNFSLAGLALSTANLYSATQPGGSLFGLQEANPLNFDAAYGGETSSYGTTDDYMVGKKIGGTNVFGGGFALYNAQGEIVGGVGVSGDTSCADHVIGWKVRHILNLDDVPAGVAGAAPGTDNIIYDITGGQSASGFGQPHCADAATESTIAADLPVSYPVGPTQ